MQCHCHFFYGWDTLNNASDCRTNGPVTGYIGLSGNGLSD